MSASTSASASASASRLVPVVGLDRIGHDDMPRLETMAPQLVISRSALCIGPIRTLSLSEALKRWRDIISLELWSLARRRIRGSPLDNRQEALSSAPRPSLGSATDSSQGPPEAKLQCLRLRPMRPCGNGDVGNGDVLGCWPLTVPLMIPKGGSRVGLSVREAGLGRAKDVQCRPGLEMLKLKRSRDNRDCHPPRVGAVGVESSFLNSRS